jgi:hypothetical protein
VYVSNQLRQIAIRLAAYRLVPSLKQVPNLLVLAIEILAVAGQQTLYDTAYLIVLPFNQKVRVVWHQAVGVKR